MAAMQEHTQVMSEHMGAVQAQHQQMGGAVGKLYEALMLAQQLIQDLNAAYAELAGGHEALGAAVEGANAHTSTMHDAAGQLTDAGAPS